MKKDNMITSSRTQPKDAGRPEDFPREEADSGSHFIRPLNYLASDSTEPVNGSDSPR